MKEIIEKLEAERALQDISYEKVAEQMGSTRGVVYKALTQKGVPKFDTLLGIAKALGYKLELVKEGAGPKIKNIFSEEAMQQLDSNIANLEKAKKLGNDIAKIDLVKKAKAIATKTEPNITYSCGCKVENNLFKRKNNCKLLKQQHKK